MMNMRDAIDEFFNPYYQEYINPHGFQNSPREQNCYKQPGQTAQNMQNNSHSDEQEDSVKQTLKFISPQNQAARAPRKKNYIMVGSQRRNKYMKAIKGTNQETNDLSINVCSLVRSYFSEYRKFEQLQTNTQNKMKNFQQSSSSLNSLKQLLISKNQDIEQNRIFQQENTNQQKKVKEIGKFVFQKVEEVKTIKQILSKNKMKFSNKIILLKYLQSVKKLADNPQEFKGWKNTRLSF